ncbi:MAG: hypothetical protein JKY65_05500 [Planctomycetes bacterium]|nr:hypothetical protein [Planctomycetota bacterium]
MDRAACRGARDRKRLAGLRDDDEKGLALTDTPGGPQEVLHLTEPGLYHLLNTAKKEEAKPFQRWVNHVVLPSIRKTGVIGSSQSARRAERGDCHPTTPSGSGGSAPQMAFSAVRIPAAWPRSKSALRNHPFLASASSLVASLTNSTIWPLILSMSGSGWVMHHLDGGG